MSKKHLGKLWKNTKKVEDKHPDFRGYIYIDDIKYDLGGWLRQDDEGRPYYSLSGRQYEGRTEAPDDGVKRFTKAGVGSAHDLNDSVPF